jgi:CHAD domain-containing protein
MAKYYKWEIKELSADKSLKVSSKSAMQQRLQSVTLAIKKYFEEETPENLHEIRIALRRLRYNMEIFISCFDKNKFIAFYQIVEHLQDMTGTTRDFDVLAENMRNISKGKINLKTNSFLKNIETKNCRLKELLTLDLMKFTHSKELKDFSKILL